MANQFGAAPKNCPRCQAPLQPGEQQCHVCGLALDPANLQEFYKYQQQMMGASAPQMLAQQRVSSRMRNVIGFSVVGIILAACIIFAAAFLILANTP